MLSAGSTQTSSGKHLQGQATKIAMLLVISIGLFSFSEEFSPTKLYEPQSRGWILWFSYAKDLIQPFALYFFLCLGERWLKTWQGRAMLAFALPAILEFGQGLYYRVSSGHYVGSFDPVDFAMYAAGVGLAAIVEQKLFSRILKFW